jgi:RNA polymerase sigma factor (sigma-70 family)
MAERSAAVLRQFLRTAAGDGAAAPSDRDLLRCFAETGDQAAFGKLFRRHAGMVLGVCRRVLPGEQDAEDACQATFLLLARKANSGRWQPSVANWLYLTARRVAHNARVAAARRVRREKSVAVPDSVQPVDRMTGRELLAALDEELDKLPPRFREPLVLCYLEGLTRDEAAARLGVSAVTVKSQLDRGRKRLAEALARRGCAPGAGLLALATTTPAGPPPVRLVQAVLAANHCNPPAAVAELAREIATTRIGTSRLAGLMTLVTAVVLGAGFTTGWMAAVGQPPQQAMPARTGDSAANEPGRLKAAADRAKGIVLKGTVFGADGKPFPGAKLLLVGKGDGPVELGVTAADGRFTVVVPRDRRPLHLVARAEGFGCDFVFVTDAGSEINLRLVKDNAIRGRVVDTQGRPVPGVSVYALEIAAYQNESLDSFLQAWKNQSLLQAPPPSRQQLREAPASLFSTTTDAQGHFSLSGLGSERFVVLRLGGAGIADAEVQVVNRAGFDPGPYNQATRTKIPEGFEKYVTKWMLNGPDVAVVAELEKPIHGVVTDADTGKPRPGVDVRLTRNGMDLLPVLVKARTDANGRFTLHGARKAKAYMLEVESDPIAGYMLRQVSVDDTIGYGPVSVDFRVFKGVIVKGRVRDRSTGEGVSGYVAAAVLAGNPFAARYAEFHLSAHSDPPREVTADDGSFRLVTIPGPVLLISGAHNTRQPGTGRHVPAVFRQPVPDPNYPQYFRYPTYLKDPYPFPFSFSYLSDRGDFPVEGNWCKVLDTKPGTEVVEQDVILDRASELKVLLRDTAGNALTDVKVAGTRTETYLPWDMCTKDTCTVYNLQSGKTRRLVFFDPARSLAATLTLQGDEKAPLTVTLRPTGTVKGRLVGEDGKPLAGVVVDLNYHDWRAAVLHANPLWHRQLVTGADGSFSIQTVIADVEFDFSFNRLRKQFRITSMSAPALSVQSGKVKDLGDLHLEPLGE